ncbi:MAG: arginase family protein [Planctomycetota bacterium]
MGTILPNPRVSPRFAGLCTFGRYPRLEDVAPANRPVDWAVFGVPHDAGVTYRPGARFGPRAIREASQYLKRFHLEHAVDVCTVLSLADAGDAPVAPYSCKENIAGVRTWAGGLADAGRTKLMALGGDHSIAYANIAATWDRLGRPAGGLALIQFDSHLDTVPSVWGEEWGHASPFFRLIEDGIVDPKAMLAVGVKGPLNVGTDLDYAKGKGVTIVPYSQWEREGDKAIRAFTAALKGRPTYITFDIDVVDPAYAPGTGTLSVGGFTSAQALTLLRSLKGINVAGGDVVEVLPDRDPTGITAFLAAHIAFEILALDAAAKAS